MNIQQEERKLTRFARIVERMPNWINTFVWGMVAGITLIAFLIAKRLI